MKSILIISLLSVITYALAQGIRYGNLLGIILATCSLVALGVALYLDNKLQQHSSED